MKNIYQKICGFDLAAQIQHRYRQTDGVFWSAFFAAFIALNLIFIYHSAQFLFGDHDWKYLRDGVPLNAGLFEGRFSQFIAINLLSYGEILPIINNILGIAGFSFGISLLARYWKIPHHKSAYILFALFASITPYILSFMYFAFLIIPVLSWNVFIIGSLIIAEKETTFSIKKTLCSTTLLVLALGGYPPVINLIGVALLTRQLIAVMYERKSLKQLLKDYRWSIINIILACLIYKIALIIMAKTGALNSSYYNLQTAPFSQWGEKLGLIVKDFFLQFSATLPFITIPYKIATIIMSTIGAVIIIKSQKRLLSIILGFGIFLAGLTTLFLSTSIEETEFSPRIDFFGLMYGITGMYAIILKSKTQYIKNIANLIAVISICISINNLYEAQKVWKLGFESEMKAYKRIIKRFESAPLFNQLNRYIVVQGGALTFRSKYYHESYQYPSDDLLNISYVPGMASGVMWNYYAPKDYTDTKSYVYTFRAQEDFKRELEKATVWPKEGSIEVGAYWILLSLTREGLEYLKNQYLR